MSKDMTIEVLGPGCTKCNQLHSAVSAVIRKMGVKVEVLYIKDMDKILNRGIMMTPALIISGKTVCQGRIPKNAEIMKWVLEARDAI